MGTVGRRATRLSREVEYLRRSVVQAYMWSGERYLVRRRWTMADVENGLVVRCPYCWDDVLKQSTNTRCPHCFGTTIYGGYRPTEIIWGSMSMNGSRAEDALNEKGVRDEQTMTLKVSCEPIFHGGDVFAEIRSMDGERVTELGRVFVAQRFVTYKTVAGRTSTSTYDAARRVEDVIVSQVLILKPILKTDQRYATEGFWAWGLDAEYSQPNGADPVPDWLTYDPRALRIDGRHIKMAWSPDR